jgi:hypothetical protein
MIPGGRQAPLETADISKRVSRSRVSLAALLAIAVASPTTSSFSAPRSSEADTASYIISKILDNFQYRGREKLSTWTIDNPVITYRHPFFDISFVKQMHTDGAFDESFEIHFRINMSNTKSVGIVTNVLRVDCISNCVDVVSNGQVGRYPYFWINAIVVNNPIDARRIDRAFIHLQSFARIPREPFD